VAATLCCIKLAYQCHTETSSHSSDSTDRGLGSQPIIVVINFGSDCEEDWAKAQEDAIAEYKKMHGDVVVRGARFVRVCFI
jgi:hypothetical protein